MRKKKSVGAKMLKRVLASILAIMLVISLMPGVLVKNVVKAAESMPSGSLKVELYEKYAGFDEDFVRTNTSTGLADLKDDYKLKDASSDTPVSMSKKTQIMYVLTFSKFKETSGHPEKDTNYTIELSEKLSLQGGKTDDLKATLSDGREITYGTATWSTNGTSVTIRFNEKIEEAEGLKGAQFAIGSLLNAKSEEDVSDKKVEINIPATSENVAVKVNEYEPGTSTYPDISKTHNKGDKAELSNTSDTVTWTVNYTGYKDGKYGGEVYTTAHSDNVPKYIVDKIPDGMEVTEVKIGSTAVEIGSSEGQYTYTLSTNGGGTLKYYIPVAKAQTDFALTYKTSLTTIEKAKQGAKSLENWLDGTKWEFTNEVSLTKTGNPDNPGDIVVDSTNNPLTDTKTVKVKDSEKPAETNKAGTIVVPSSAEDKKDPTKYKVKWTVDVDPKINTSDFSKFEIIDVLGNAHVFPSDSSALGTKIQKKSGDSYTDYVGSYQPSVTLDSSTKTIKFDLKSFANSTDCVGEAFRIEYTTAIARGYFDGTYSDADLGNTADLDWELDVSGTTVSKSDTKKATVIGKDLAKSVTVKPIGKEFVSYDWSTRTFKWNISFGSDMTGAELKQVHLVETPQKRLGEVTQRLILPGETKEQAETRIRNNIKTGLVVAGFAADASSISDGAIAVTITEGTSKTEDSSVDIIINANNGTTNLGQNINKKVTFTLETYQVFTTWIAGNHTAADNFNKVELKKEGTIKSDDTEISGDMPAEAEYRTNGNMYAKEATKYDPNTGVISWKISLNDKQANAGNILFVDWLPDGLKYVDNSAKLKSTALSWNDVAFNEVAVTPVPATMPGSGTAKNEGINNITSILPSVTDHTLGKGKVLYFVVKDLNNKATLTYDTILDTDSATIKNNDGTIEFSNTVDSHAEDPYNPGKWDEVRAARESATAKVKNTVLDKSNTGVTSGKVNYKIVVNPNSLKLLPAGSPATAKIEVTDKLPGGLLLDEGSVTVSYGTVTSKSSTGKAADFTSASNVTKGAAYTPDTKTYDLGTNTLTLTIDDEKPFVIEYSAFVLASSAKLENKVSLRGTLLQEADKNQNESDSLEYSSYSRGIFRLPSSLAGTYTQIILEKVDEDDQTTYLPDAEFDIYKSKTGKPIGTGKTDKWGYASIIVKNTDISGVGELYIRETKAPAGYGLDQRWKTLKVSDIKGAGDDPDITITNKYGGPDYEPENDGGFVPGPTPPAPGPDSTSPDTTTPDAETPDTPPADDTVKPIPPEEQVPVDPNDPNAITVKFETEIGVTPETQIKLPGYTADDPKAPLNPLTLRPGTVIDGYRFEGWYLDKELTTPYNFGTVLTESITLYAKWTALGVAKSPKTGDMVAYYWLAFAMAGLVTLLGRATLITASNNKGRRKDK